MEIVYYPDMFVDPEEKLKALVLFWNRVKTIVPPSQIKVTILGQSGECEWHQDDLGLHITAFNNHTVQIIAYPGSESEFVQRRHSWGPDWPVAIKITNVEPWEK